ncbi:MAG: DUF4350 domain-containing protein [Candidatus Hodarchaeales archaeon]|jgi:hypothetical protein
MKKIEREHLLGIALIVFVIMVIPPFLTGPFTIENTNWDGLSEFKALIEENRSISVSQTTTPLRLSGDIKADIIIIVGGNLPYFTEESNYLRQFVEAGGDVILFEDHGHARTLTSAFGISFGGTVIDQNYHDRNPFLPIVNQSGIGIPQYDSSSHTIVFNKGARVQKSRTIEETTYYSLFSTQGQTWEDQNHDGKFYREKESVVGCNLGGILAFESGGNFIVIGDSAFPTNDMISQRDNQAWLSELISYLMVDGEKKVLFDESRKLWIPPTGKAAIGLVSVLIMGAFHSPLIAIISLIVLGGIIGMKREDHISNIAKSIRKSLQPDKDTKSIAAFLQSEEEDELARLTKRNALSELYRAVLADEIRQTAPNMSPSTKIEFENYLRQRYIDVNTSNRLIKRLEKHRIKVNQNGEDINGSK